MKLINFKRGKDKKKRKSRLLRNAAIGMGVLGAGLGTAYLLRRNINESNKQIQKVVDNVKKTDYKLKTDFEGLDKNIKNYNSSSNQNPDRSNISSIKDLDYFILENKPKRKKIITSTGYESKNINRKQAKGRKIAKRSSLLEPFFNINIIKRKLYDNNSNWNFNFGKLINFKRGKDKRVRKRRMHGYRNIAFVGTLGGGLTGSTGFIGAGLYYGNKIKGLEHIKKFPTNKVRLIGLGSGLVGAGLGGYGSYLEHKQSSYFPIGKKDWKYKPFINEK